MSSWVDLDDQVVELAEAIAARMGSDKERVIKMALALLAIDAGVRLELPRKEKVDDA